MHRIDPRLEFFGTDEHKRMRNRLVRQNPAQLHRSPLQFAGALVKLAADICNHHGDRTAWAELTQLAWKARAPVEPPRKPRRWWWPWGRP